MSGNSNTHYGKTTLCRAVVETRPRVEYSHKREYVGQNGRFLLFTESSAILSVSVPDKNNTNLAKHRNFRAFCKFSNGVRIVLPFSPLQQIIKNIGVFVAGKSNGVFLD